MTNISHHIRIFEANPSDDFVEKRKLAVTALVDVFKKRTGYPDLVGLANDIAAVFVPRGHLSDATVTQTVDAISGQSQSFDKDGHEEEINVCAALAALTWIEGSANSVGTASKPEIFAMALWCALSFQKPSTNVKLEKLREEIVTVARKLTLGGAETARQRSPVVDAAFTLVDGETPPQVGEKMKATVVKAVTALRMNAALDREEIDILWWALGDWSAILKKRYSTLNADQAALVGAVELGRLMKRLPGDAHSHLALRHVANVSQKRDLGAFLGNLADARGAVQATLTLYPLLAANGHVFVLLSALSAADPKPSGAKTSRTLEEWCSRAFLEAAILQLSTLPTVIS